ncbi:MAG: DUF1286 domain-containing protein [Nitrososphaerales archaeon]|jgi:membrane-bound metal-dependent hydrolase YbcI (DUF457 family)
MKAITHHLFSAGVSLELLSLLRPLGLGPIVMVLWLSLSINYLIDLLGHVSRNGNPTRTWVTHSIFTAPLWGALIAVLSIAALSQASGSGLFRDTLRFWPAVGVLISEEHLFLDSLTQAGIYSWRRRIAIAHFRYDNLALNLGFALLGASLIAAALGS